MSNEKLIEALSAYFIKNRFFLPATSKMAAKRYTEMYSVENNIEINSHKHISSFGTWIASKFREVGMVRPELIDKLEYDLKKGDLISFY